MPCRISWKTAKEKTKWKAKSTIGDGNTQFKVSLWEFQRLMHIYEKDFGMGYACMGGMLRSATNLACIVHIILIHQMLAVKFFWFPDSWSPRRDPLFLRRHQWEKYKIVIPYQGVPHHKAIRSYQSFKIMLKILDNEQMTFQKCYPSLENI